MTPPFLKDAWLPGERAWFEYHCFESLDSCDADLWLRSHREVEIVCEDEHDGWPGSTFEERAEAGQPIYYVIRFDDGFEHSAGEDELYVDRAGWERPDPPPMPDGATLARSG